MRPWFFWFCIACWGAMVTPGWGVDCLQFKKNPAVYMNVPDWSKVVVQPSAPMDLWHGNVVATFVDNYQIDADINQVDGGYCIGINSVNAIVGYSDFTVQIDIRHMPDSCQYNAILKHEDKHIKTYLSAVDEYKADLQHALYVAADSVMPFFINSRDDSNDVLDVIHEKFQSHPELVLVKQKIRAAQEIKNKQVDLNEDGAELMKCSN